MLLTPERRARLVSRRLQEMEDLGYRNSEPKGFVTGKFGDVPVGSVSQRAIVRSSVHEYGVDATLGRKAMGRHAHARWNRSERDAYALMAFRGRATSPLHGWLARTRTAGSELSPRRIHTRAHPNPTRHGRSGKPRNLVMAGAPDVVLSLPHPHASIRGPHCFTTCVPIHMLRSLNALVNGAFAITDGPALRIAIDRNANGVIDDADTRMGGVLEICTVRRRCLYSSSGIRHRNGIVEQNRLGVGAINSTVRTRESSGVYAPPANGESAGLQRATQRLATPSGAVVTVITAGRYTDDPTVDLYG